MSPASGPLAPRRGTTMYMHTIDGKPARFDPLFEIIHRVPLGSAWRVTLVPDRETLNEQRRASKAALRREGKVPGRYGYARVEVPCVR